MRSDDGLPVVYCGGRFLWLAVDALGGDAGFGGGDGHDARVRAEETKARLTAAAKML
jgi:hypothetical protein